MRLSRSLVALVVFLAGEMNLHADDAVAKPVMQAAVGDSRFVSIEGRYQRIDGDSVQVAYPGVGLHVHFFGTSLHLAGVSWSESVYVDVIVDDGEARRLQIPPGESEVTLCEVDEGEHRVAIIKRTEGWQGHVQWRHVRCPGGRVLPAPSLPSRRLLFIGDSITAGAGADVQPTDPPQGAHNSNGRVAYGSVLARSLNAQFHLVAYGGRGLIRDWEDKRDTGTAPEYYQLALTDTPDAKWDHAAYVPDAIGICLGTNDFNPGIPDRGEYVEAFVGFVRTVRRDAPEADIFLISSPMHGVGEARSVLIEYLEETRRRLGDDSVHVVEVSHYPGRDVDSHPIAREHRAMAAELEPIFRRVLGW